MTHTSREVVTPRSRLEDEPPIQIWQHAVCFRNPANQYLHIATGLRKTRSFLEDTGNCGRERDKHPHDDGKDPDWNVAYDGCGNRA